MTGPGLERHRVRRRATVLPRFINALPTRFEVGEGPVVFNAVQVDIDPATGRALADRTDPAARRGVTRVGTPRATAARPVADRGQGRVQPPAPSTIDLHTHTTRSDGVVAPRGARGGRRGGRRPDPRLTDHDTLAGYREPWSRTPRSRPGSTLIPGVEINALVTRDLGLWEGELHILGLRRGPGRRGVRGGSSPPSATSGASGSSGRSRGCASSSCPIDDAGRRRSRRRRRRRARAGPTVARALIAAGLRRERRGRLPPAPRAGAPGLRAAAGPGPGGGHRGDPRRPAASRSLAHFREAPSRHRGRRASWSSRARRARGLLPLVRRRDTVDRGRRRSRAELRPHRHRAAPTTTATSGRTPRRMRDCGCPPRRTGLLDRRARRELTGVR